MTPSWNDLGNCWLTPPTHPQRDDSGENQGPEWTRPPVGVPQTQVNQNAEAKIEKAETRQTAQSAALFPDTHDCLSPTRDYEGVFGLHPWQNDADALAAGKVRTRSNNRANLKGCPWSPRVF